MKDMIDNTMPKQKKTTTRKNGAPFGNSNATKTTPNNSYNSKQLIQQKQLKTTPNNPPNDNGNGNDNVNENTKEGGEAPQPQSGLPLSPSGDLLCVATPVDNQPVEDPPKRKQFRKPTAAEVDGYCRERKNSIDGETFIAFYESKGWKVGANPMKDWKAAVITWEKRRYDEVRATSPPGRRIKADIVDDSVNYYQDLPPEEKERLDREWADRTPEGG
jgi:hypothetical protein